MSLDHSRYQAVMRIYDEKRQRAVRTHRKRLEALYEAMPILHEIDEQLAHGSVTAAKRSLQGDSTALDVLTKRNETLIAQKEQLLASAGYPKNYLAIPYECMECKDTGIIETGDWQEGTFSRRHCRCFRQTVIELFYMDPGRRDVLEEENFSTFSLSLYSEDRIDPATGLSHHALMQDIYQRAWDFIESFDTAFSNLLITGETGVGKTFLCNCIAKELLDRGNTVLYISAFRLFELFENYRFHHGEAGEEAIRQFSTILDCDLLIIDDLGSELNNSYTNSQLFICMEERLLRKKSIIISTNLSMSRIKGRYTERIASRLMQHYEYLKIIGDDLRIRSAMERSET